MLALTFSLPEVARVTIINASIAIDVYKRQAYGCGRPKEGATAEVRGERVRVFSSDILRRKVKDSFPDSIEWPSLGLPDDFLPLIAPSRTAFANKGARIVAHGGISLEEVIVPLIHVQRRTP